MAKNTCLLCSHLYFCPGRTIIITGAPGSMAKGCDPLIQSIASMAVQMKQEEVQAEAGTRVAAMVMDSAREQGAALVEMIEAQKEIHAHLGGSVNTWA